MQMRDLSAGNDIYRQSRRAVEAMAALERRRQILTSKGYVSEAGRTLQGMADVFAAAPTLPELENAIKQLLPDGSIVSGREYYDRIQKQLNPVWYNGGYSRPSDFNEFVKQNLKVTNYPAEYQPYVMPGVQAASYFYVTQQAQKAGSALSGFSPAPRSVVEGARMEEQARKKAVALMALAGLGYVGRGVNPCTGFADCTKITGDFEFTVPASIVNSKFPSIDYSKMNTSWMSGTEGCQTDITNKSGGKVFGLNLKDGDTDSYSNANAIRRVKAAAVVQALYNVGGEAYLTLPNLYTYGAMKAHNISELVSHIRTYGVAGSGGTRPPDSLFGDGSGSRSTYCKFDMPSPPSLDEVAKVWDTVSSRIPGGGGDTGGGGGGGGGGDTPPPDDEEKGGIDALTMVGVVGVLALGGIALYFARQNR
jgi:hypothetical protein